MIFQIGRRPDLLRLSVVALVYSMSAMPVLSQTSSGENIRLTPQQRTAVLLARWETCIDVTTRHLAKNAGGVEAIARSAGVNCEEFGAKLEPAVKEALRAMMYLSSDTEVAQQTDAAMSVLRRHVHSRAVSAVQKARSGSASSAR